ncbi:hypothetical protein AgCh_033848 [Apium graveolens]
MGHAISKFTSSEIENYPRSIYFQFPRTPKIHVMNLIGPIGLTSCSIDPIKNHLETGWLPDDAQEAFEACEPETNKEGMRLALDLIDEVMDEAKSPQ